MYTTYLFLTPSNYGPTIQIQKKAIEKKCDQVLWLLGENHQVHKQVHCYNITVLCLLGLGVQWNPSITDTFREQSFGRYTEVAFVEGLFCVQTLHLGPVYLVVISQLAVLQGWPLSGVPLYSLFWRLEEASLVHGRPLSNLQYKRVE